MQWLFVKKNICFNHDQTESIILRACFVNCFMQKKQTECIIFSQNWKADMSCRLKPALSLPACAWVVCVTCVSVIFILICLVILLKNFINSPKIILANLWFISCLLLLHWINIISVIPCLKIIHDICDCHRKTISREVII